MSVRAVFFDSGGTLMIPIGGHWFPGHRFFEICTSFGVGITDDEMLVRACTAAGQYLSANHHAVSDENAEERQFAEYYRIVLGQLEVEPRHELVLALARAIVREVNFEPVADARGVLEHIKRQRIPMAVLTDAWPSVRTKLRLLGYHDYFETIVISAEEGCTKPHMGMFAPALNAIAVEPGEVLFVDDSLDLVVAAQQIGFQALLADYGERHPEVPRRIGRLREVLRHI